MDHQGSDSEPHVSELQAQIDRLVLALHQWRQTQEHLQPMERRLSQLTEECGAILTGWLQTSQRHAEVIGQLETQLSEWRTLEARLREENRDRLRELEGDLHRDITDLSRELHAVAGEWRRASARPGAIGREEMRVKERVRSVEASAEAERLELLERAMRGGQDEVKSAIDRVERQFRKWWVALAAVALGLAGLGGFAFHLNTTVNEMTARVGAAEREAEVARDTANRDVAALLQRVERPLADARQANAHARIIGAVLSAPDLVRYALTGGSPGAPVYALLFWSRSHGLIFSTSHVPPAPPNTTYQLWLLTGGTAVNAGVFSPDSDGRVTWASDVPPEATRPVTGAEVTIEPFGGAAVRSGTVFLTRAP